MSSSCEFHLDKQLFQVAGAGDWTTDYKDSALPLHHGGLTRKEFLKTISIIIYLQATFYQIQGSQMVFLSQDQTQISSRIQFQKKEQFHHFE